VRSNVQNAITSPNPTIGPQTTRKALQAGRLKRESEYGCNGEWLS